MIVLEKDNATLREKDLSAQAPAQNRRHNSKKRSHTNPNRSSNSRNFGQPSRITFLIKPEPDDEAVKSDADIEKNLMVSADFNKV